MSGFAGVSAVALAAAVVGEASGPLRGWERMIALAAAAMMVMRGPPIQIAGVTLFALLVLWSARRAAPAVGTPATVGP